MPELPDVDLYVERLTALTKDRAVRGVRLRSPFLLRTHTPPLMQAVGRGVRGFRRLGKRIVFEFGEDLYWVLHLMIAGRLRWRLPGAEVPGRFGLLAVDFDHGTLLLTEAGTKKRASLYVLTDAASVQAHDPGGLEPLLCSEAEFDARLRRENRTLKRALTDPRIFSGIGNAYSDEILFEAGLSPLARTGSLEQEEVCRLREAVITTLTYWTERLRAECTEPIPEKVTAFRDGMAVHGRYKEPCVRCDAPVLRVRYATNELNYCARCQNGGRVLADRSLSRLLHGDWPSTLEELEEWKTAAKT